MKIQRSLVIGSILSTLRAMAGIPAGGVAAAVGMKQSFDVSMEKGHAFISLARLRAYARGLRLGGMNIQTWEIVAAIEEAERLLVVDGHRIKERPPFGRRRPPSRGPRQKEEPQPIVEAAVRRALVSLDLAQLGQRGGE